MIIFPTIGCTPCSTIILMPFIKQNDLFEPKKKQFTFQYLHGLELNYICALRPWTSKTSTTFKILIFILVTLEKHV